MGQTPEREQALRTESLKILSSAEVFPNETGTYNGRVHAGHSGLDDCTTARDERWTVHLVEAADTECGSVTIVSVRQRQPRFSPDSRFSSESRFNPELRFSADSRFLAESRLSPDRCG